MRRKRSSADGLPEGEADAVAPEEARAFRPRRRAIWIGIGLHALVALVFVGVPYARGRLRAQRTQHRFAQFAACLWGGTPVADPGLGLPHGEQTHFASQVIHAPPRWPGNCRRQLTGFTPPPSWFLYPGVKEAERKLRQVVDLVETHLDQLQQVRSAGNLRRVPSLPRRAARKLAAAVADQAERAGAYGSSKELAFRLDEAIPLVRPTRVPLRSSAEQGLRMTPRGDGMEAVAMDRKGIARTRVGGGSLRQQRVKRPALVRGVVPGPEAPWLVWAMEETRCRNQPKGCARHAMGVAPFRWSAESPPRPFWIAAHPDGRLDRAVAVRAGSRVDVIARRTGRPAAEVRRFVLPDAPQAKARSKDENEKGDAPAPEPERSEWRIALEGFGQPDEALLTRAAASSDAERTPRVLWTSSADDGVSVRVQRLGAEKPSVRTLGHFEGAEPEQAWLTRCRSYGGWVAFGARKRVRIARLESEPHVSALAEIPIAGAIDPKFPAADAVRVVCDPTHAHLLARTVPDDRLVALTCWVGEPNGQEADKSSSAEATRQRLRCGKVQSVADDVKRFDGAREGNRTVVAYASAADEGQIRVVTLGPRGRKAGEPTIPAACWSHDGGFCGTPRVAARTSRFLVGAVEGTDLRVVASSDAGRHWRAMRGL